MLYDIRPEKQSVSILTTLEPARGKRRRTEWRSYTWNIQHPWHSYRGWSASASRSLSTWSGPVPRRSHHHTTPTVQCVWFNGLHCLVVDVSARLPPPLKSGPASLSYSVCPSVCLRGHIVAAGRLEFVLMCVLILVCYCFTIGWYAVWYKSVTLNNCTRPHPPPPPFRSRNRDGRASGRGVRLHTKTTLLHYYESDLCGRCISAVIWFCCLVA